MGIFGRVDQKKNKMFGRQTKSKIVIRHGHVMLGVNSQFQRHASASAKAGTVFYSVHPSSVWRLSSSPDIDHPFVRCLSPSQVPEPVGMLRIVKHKRNWITMAGWKTRCGVGGKARYFSYQYHNMYAGMLKDCCREWLLVWSYGFTNQNTPNVQCPIYYQSVAAPMMRIMPISKPLPIMDWLVSEADAYPFKVNCFIHH